MIAAALHSFPALAAENSNLERGQPTALEDAYVIPDGSREWQSFLSYERTGWNADRFKWNNVLNYGLSSHAQLRLHAPLVFGSEDIDDLNGIGLEGMYAFMDDLGSLPALALSGRLDFPVGEELSGEDKDGIDTTLKFLASKKIIEGKRPGALHFNAGWSHNFDDHAAEREDYYQLTAGYSQGISAATTVIFDYAREQHVQTDSLENILEIGARQNIGDNTVANVGGGFGFGDDSPDFRLTVGIARSF